ncbi:unnamed protein product [Closterium sp. NIES-53]
MLALCREHRLEHRTKHIALRYFLARELQQRGQLRLAYVTSEANTADIFTTALPPGDHQRFCTMLACFALLDWSCDLLFSPILPMGCWRSRCLAPLSRPTPTTAAAAARATVAGGGGAAGIAAARGGQQRPLPLPDDPTPQQLRERVIQRGSPGGGGFGFMWPQRPHDYASQRCIPGRVEAVALSSSESAVAPGAGESAAALGARESADALGASVSTAIGPTSAEALHTFTLDSGASRCFFRDCTTVTPLAASVPVSLADPTGGPVVARASTVLPCLAVPSGSLSGLHLPAFSTNLLSNAVLQDEWVDTFIPGGQRVAIWKCSQTGHHLATFTRQPGSGLYTQTLLWHHRLGHPSLPRLRSMHSRLVSGLPRSLPSLPRSPAPPCLPCVEGQQRAAPHSSKFPPTTAPLHSLHMDLETSPTLRWTGKVGDASVFWVWGALSLVCDAKASKLSSRTLRCVFLGFPTDAPPWHFYHLHEHRGPAPSGVSQVDPPPLVEPLEISSDSSGPAEGGDPAADDTAATRRSPRLETPPGFPPRPSSPPPQPAAVDSGAEPGGAETEGEGYGGAATGGADSGGAASPSGGGAVGDPAGGLGAGQPPQLDLLETLSPQAIRAWIVRRGSLGGGGYGPAGAGAASLGGTTRAGGTGGTPGGAGGAAGAGGAGATSPRGATGVGGAGPTSPGAPCTLLYPGLRAALGATRALPARLLPCPAARAPPCPATRTLPCCAARAPPHPPARAPPYPAARAPPCPAASAPPCPAAHAPPCPATRAPPCPAARALPCPVAHAPPCPAARALPCPAARALPWPAARTPCSPRCPAARVPTLPAPCEPCCPHTLAAHTPLLPSHPTPTVATTITAAIAPETLSPQQLCEWVIRRGRSGAGAWGPGGTGQQRESRRQETLSLQQLREWVIQRNHPGDGGYGAGGNGQQRKQRQQETLSPH